MVPAPTTATCFTMVSPSHLSEERFDLAARQRRLLVVDEVAGLGRDRHLDLTEELVEAVGPFALEDGIVGAPEHARRYRDRPTRALWHLAADHRHSRLMRADVPVEAALKVAGLHEIIDPRLEVLVEGMGIVRPMPQEMPDIGAASLARAPDQRRGPGLLMKRLVPDLREMLR